MIIVSIRRLKRRAFLSASLTIAIVLSLFLLNGCGLASPEPEDIMVGNNGDCVCNGTQLHCNAQNNQPAVDVANSEYCNLEVVKANGVCTCQGAVLSCDVRVCTFGLGGCMGVGEQKHVTLCNPNNSTNSLFPNTPADSAMAGVGTILYPGDPQCAGGTPPPPPPPPPQQQPATPGGSGESCACAGVDYICKNADGSTKSASYNATQCGGSGACGCRGPNSTLACPDGTYADFNPTCTGGGGCTLTKETCVSQGYYDVDTTTCTCLGKP